MLLHVSKNTGQVYRYNQLTSYKEAKRFRALVNFIISFIILVVRYEHITKYGRVNCQNNMNEWHSFLNLLDVDYAAGCACSECTVVC